MNKCIRHTVANYYKLLAHVIQCCDKRLIMQYNGKLEVHRKRVAALIGFIVISISFTCFAMSVQLGWDANTESDLAGYKCYYRGKNVSTFTRYTTVYGLANQTLACNCTVKNLAANGRYSFVVTAFNRNEVTQVQYSSSYFNGYTTARSVIYQESAYSNQVGAGATVVKRNIVFKGGGVFK